MWMLCELYYVRTYREKPLAVYAFTTDSGKKEKITASTSSGGVVFNDIMVQFAGKCNYIPYMQHYCSASCNVVYSILEVKRNNV